MNASNPNSNFTLNLTQWSISKAKNISRPALVVSVVAFVMSAYPTLPALAASGDLDTSFGTNGKVIGSYISNGGYSESGASAVAVQSDGKIVTAGTAFDTSGDDFGLSRHNTNGSLDSTFGNSGLVTTRFQDDSLDHAFAMAIQSNGKIVVAGSTYSRSTGDSDFGIARYNTDGTLDNTFSGNGKVTTGFGGSDEADAVAIQSNGKIVVAGTTQNPGSTDTDFAIARYNTDGTLDSNFRGIGKVITALGGYEHATAMAIQPNGKVVVAGYTLVASTGTSDDFAIVRYNTDGTLDNTFSGNGYVRTDFTGDYDRAYAVAVQTDGKIVAAGQTWNTNSPDSPSDRDFGLVRYNTDGSLDNTFSGDGKAVTGFGADESAYALVIQPNGKLVAAGSRLPGDHADDFALARYNSDGTLDTTFSGNGKTLTNFGGSDGAGAMARQSDGKIVVAGSTNLNNISYFALARYQP